MLATGLIALQEATAVAVGGSPKRDGGACKRDISSRRGLVELSSPELMELERAGQRARLGHEDVSFLQLTAL